MRVLLANDIFILLDLVYVNRMALVGINSAIK